MAPGISGGGDGNRAVDARQLLQLLRRDDLDAAIEAGLAAFVHDPALSGEENADIVAARDRLLAAWAARERYRARAARLARRAAERKAARAAPPSPAAPPATVPADGVPPALPPALPAAAAAALARARARMAGKP